MSILPCAVRTDPQGRELIRHGTALFPAACYHDRLDLAPVPWHWHDEWEAAVLWRGSALVAVEGEKRVLRRGEGFFINAGVLHAAWDHAGSACQFHSVVFHPRLVGGGVDSVFWQKYVQPLLEGGAPRGVFLDRSARWHREALEAVERLNPSLIITDLKMPRMDGIEMLRCLRDRGNHVYVIILTAYDSFTYAQSALRLGAVDFLLKPFHDGDLEQAVTALRRRMEGAEREEPALPGLKKGDKSKYVLEAMDYIGKHYQDPNISISDIALDLGISEGHLSRTFKKETDYTLLNYLTRYRIHKAMELLRDCRVKVYEVAEQVGYRDITYFSATFKKLVGV